LRNLTETDVRRIAREMVGILNRGIVPGRIESTEDGTYRANLARILHGEVARRVKRVQPYGFISRPTPGMETFVGPILGSSGNLIYFGENDSAFRPMDLEPGEVAVYSDEGDALIFRRGRDVNLDVGANVAITAGEDVTATAGGIVKLDAGTDVDIDAANDLTIDAGATMVLTAGTLTEIVAAAVVAAQTPANAQLVVMEEFLTLYDNHEHAGGGGSTKSIYTSDKAPNGSKTSIFKAE